MQLIHINQHCSFFTAHSTRSQIPNFALSRPISYFPPIPTSLKPKTLSFCSSLSPFLLSNSSGFSPFSTRRRRFVSVIAAAKTSASDYYSVLNVGKDASLQEIKASYRKLARQVHSHIYIYVFVVLIALLFYWEWRIHGTFNNVVIHCLCTLH